METAKELAVAAKQAKPDVSYGYSTDDSTVAVLKDNKWIAVAGRILTGGFASLPVQLLINGVNPVDKLDFVLV